MNILNKLTIKNLKMNKKRTIVTIIGIMLSVALICAVAGIVTSFQKTLAIYAKEESGNYHVNFENVNKSDIKYITQSKKTEAYFKTQTLGYSELEEIKNEDKPYLYVMEYDDKALKEGGVHLVDGRLPKTDSEIIIPNHLIYNGKVDIKIGDKIKLEIGDRVSEGHVLNQSNPFYNDEGEHNIETIENKVEKEYTVVGTMERASFEDYSAPGYTAISYMEKENEKINISVLCKKPNQYDDLIKEVNGVTDINTEGKYSWTANEQLLRGEGVNLSDGTLTTIYGLAAIIIVIIVVSSIFVIKNSFSISITERIRQYGMFSSVGATSKQIKGNVLFEGLILGLIGIPLGIILGMVAISIVLWLVNLILADYLNGIKFVYSVPLIPILISVLVGAITIFISSLLPAIKASKVSPIDAIRSNNDIKIKSKKLKTPKIFKKIFKIGGEISYKNLKRSKKKYRTTVISIVVSVAIFIALSSFIQYGFKLSNVYYKELSYNFLVYDTESNSKKSLEIFDKISKVSNVKDYSIVKGQSVIVKNKYLSKEYLKYLATLENEEETYINIVSINSNTYNDYLKKLNLYNKDLSDKAILIDKMTYYDEGKYKDIKTTKLNVNDKIEISASIEDKTKDYSLEIAAISDERCLGIESSPVPLLIVPDKTFSKIFADEFYINDISIYSDDPYKLSNTLDDLKQRDSSFNTISYINFEEEQKAQNAMVLVISIFLYGFITVITLIGVTNIFNTITTNMILRSKEFAMLKSIGMTKKEFNSMIRLESILYGFKALIIGIPIGLALSYLMYKAFGNTLDTGYIIPWASIIISIIFVFIIIGITMKYSVYKINKQNIIETIRNDNI